MTRRKSFNFDRWVEENRHRLVPPISNMHLFDEKTEMVVMVIGGGNERTDYHDNPVDEFYYQVRGNIVLKVSENGEHYDVPIGAGDVFYIPPHVRHSPQRRDEASIGLVVEGKRSSGQEDGFEWFCFGCGNLIHRVQVPIVDIVADLPPLFETFYQSNEARTCKKCGDFHPGKTPPSGWT
tara:strand:+ start:150 stop:689 length:540 start_codon:yes stop_codon:yes gene_type:complete